MPSGERKPAAFEWVPPHDASNGDLAAKLGVELGLPPDDDQRAILDATYAYNEADPSMPVCSTVGSVAPRQNIKTSTWEIAALTDLIVFQEPLHVWTAHLTKTSRKTFEHMCHLIDSNPELKSLFRPHRTANGSEAIELRTGERIEFYARSKGAGRGITARKITMDEALFLEPADMGALGPTMVTIPDAQIRYGSSAGLAHSDVLRGIRDRGRTGGDPRLAYFEWCAPKRDCEQPDCPHVPVDEIPGCVLDDRKLWAAANPALGRRITEASLLEQRKLLPPEEFMREFLGWWEDPVDAGSVIPFDTWQALRAPPPESDPDAFGLDMTWDREWASIGWFTAGYCDIHAHRRGSGWVVEECRALQAKYGAPLWVDPKGPAATLVEPLRDAGVRVEECTGEDYRKACGDFFDAAMQGRLKHSGFAALDAAVAGAQVTGGANGWVWDKKRGAIISPLVAVTLARWGTQNTSVYDTRGLTVI